MSELFSIWLYLYRSLIIVKFFFSSSFQSLFDAFGCYCASISFDQNFFLNLIDEFTLLNDDLAFTAKIDRFCSHYTSIYDLIEK